MSLPGLVDSIVQRLAAISGGDAVALICLLVAGAFALSVAKNAVKVVCSALALLAVLYLIDPTIYSTALNIVGRFWDASRSLLANHNLSEFVNAFST